MKDRELHKQLLRRDTKALKEIIDTYSPSVYSLVNRILKGVGTSQDLEECCSDVFHAAWEQADRYDSDRATLRTWLLMLARYKALDSRRKLSCAGKLNLEVPNMEHLPDLSSETPENSLLQSEKRQQVLNALAQLKPLDKELVYRRYFLFEPVETMAKEMGLTRQAADNRLWRARKTLRVLLTEKKDEEAVSCEK